jgi:hypothetical protein
MFQNIECPKESLKQLDILEFIDCIIWQPDITLVEGIDQINKVSKRIATGYRTYFGVETKVLVLENFNIIQTRDKLNIKSTVQSLKFNSSIDGDSFEVRVTSRPKSLKKEANFLLPLKTQKLDSVEDSRVKENSTHHMMAHSEEALISNQSENFQKSLELIKDAIISKITKRSRHLKLGLSSITAVICIFITVIIIQTRHISIESFKSLDSIYSISELRTTTAYLTLISTELYLIDRGHSFNRTREDIQTLISSLSLSYKDILRDLNDIGDSDYLFEHVKFPNQIFWEYQNSEFVDRKISLVDTVKEIILRCDYLSHSDFIDVDNKECLEIYRNGSDNWFASMNNLVSKLIEYSDSTIRNDFDIVKWLSVSLGILVFILIISVVGVPYCILYKLRRSIWDIIFSIKFHILIPGEAKVIERLSFIHNEEHDISNRTHIIEKRSIHQIHRGFKVFLVLLLAFLMGVFGFLIYYNKIYIKDRIELINESSYYYNLARLYRAHLFRSIFFMREMQYQNIYLQDYPLTNDPYELLHGSLDIIEDTKDNILGVSKISTEIFDNFFDHSNNGYFSFGMHSLLLELIQQFRYISQSLRENKNYIQMGGLTLEDITFQYCEKILNVLIVNIEKGTNEVKDNEYLRTVINTTVFMIGLIIYTIVSLFWVVSYIRNIILTEFHVLNLLPISNSMNIISKLKTI